MGPAVSAAWGRLRRRLRRPGLGFRGASCRPAAASRPWRCFRAAERGGRGSPRASRRGGKPAAASLEARRCGFGGVGGVAWAVWFPPKFGFRGHLLCLSPPDPHFLSPSGLPPSWVRFRAPGFGGAVRKPAAASVQAVPSQGLGGVGTPSVVWLGRVGVPGHLDEAGGGLCLGLALRPWRCGDAVGVSALGLGFSGAP